MSRYGSPASSSSCWAPAGTRCWGRPGWRGSARRKRSSWPSIGHSPLPYIIALVAALVIAYTIAWLLPKLGPPSAGSGAATGAALALALIGTTLATNYGFEARPLSLWLHQRRLHGGRHGHHGRHRRPLEEEGVTRRRRTGASPMPDLTRRLARCYTGAVHDVLRMMGHDDIVLPPGDQGHRARAPGSPVRCGPSSGHIDRTKIAARDAARLVHAARARRRPVTSSSASPTITRSR